MPLDLTGLPPWPEDDFSQYGDVEQAAIGKYQAVAGSQLHRNWLAIPHVTHHDDLDVTEAEQRRSAWNTQNALRISPLAPLVRAVAAAIDRFPIFGSSLGTDGKTLIYKKYRHIGIAVETPKGLLVPVLRNADARSLSGLATEIALLTEKARSRGLSMAEMAGGVITLSSLGHIGGTGFTPIINAPQVAIVGVTKLVERPVFGDGNSVLRRSFLPVSLSYDHRVINGADTARFVRAIGEELNGITYA